MPYSTHHNSAEKKNNVYQPHSSNIRQLYNTDTSSPVPLYLGLVLRDYIPPVNFRVAKVFMFLSFPSLGFPHHTVSIIMSLGLPVLHVVILPWSSTGFMTFTPSSFWFILLFVASCCTGFYLFVLCLILHLLPVSLVRPLYSTIVSGVSRPCWLCFYYAMALGYNFPILCFVLDYPFIAQIFFFLPPTLLMFVFSCVSLLHRLEFLPSCSFSLKLH